ncbi:MAG TPA: OB-fold nucleic acid binding domain-containing protein, partial [Candidatus Synoicihabitans sp.]|nr:OB-fold nucleic acid binding domain-containing protein [Candidatus Synoicihabitans sp.]
MPPIPLRSVLLTCARACRLPAALLLGAAFSPFATPALAQSSLSAPVEPAAAHVNADAIRSIPDFWAVPRRLRENPIELEVVALYYDPGWGNLWARVGDAYGFLPLGPGFDVRSGDRFLIEGTVTPPRVITPQAVRCTILERGIVEPPLDARGRVRDFGALRARMATLEGIFVREILTEHDHYRADFVSEGFLVHVYHWTPTPRSLGLPEGAVVRLTGLYNPMHESRSDGLEIDLWVPDLSKIEVAGNLSTDPRFDRPRVLIEELPRLFNEGAPPVRIAGLVHAYVPGKSVTIRDHTGQVIVQTLQNLSLQVGDVVEIFGRPFTGGADWTIRAAVLRRADATATRQLQKEFLTRNETLRLADQVLALDPKEAAAGRPVDLTGVVIRSALNTGTIFLRDASGSVRVDVTAFDHPLLKTGSGIRIRGVTISGAFAPAVRAHDFEQWGQAVQPDARPTTLDQA